jgi:hypothetical protein
MNFLNLSWYRQFQYHYLLEFVLRRAKNLSIVHSVDYFFYEIYIHVSYSHILIKQDKYQGHWTGHQALLHLQIMKIDLKND